MWDDDSMYPYLSEEAFAGVLNARMANLLKNKNLARHLRQNMAQQAAASGATTRPLTINRAALASLGRGVSSSGVQAAQVAALAANPVELARGDDVYYGLDSGSAGVGAGTSASLSTTPQKRHIPKRLTVSSTVANNFVISDIRVGVEPVLATTSNMSMAIFIQDATTPSFRAVVCEIGMDFTVVVTNITSAAARFTAAVAGTYLPPAGC